MCLNETYSKVRVVKRLSDSVPIQNCIKQGDALSPLLFNFVLEYAICKVERNTETLIDASKEVGLEINIEKIKYMFLYHHQNADQNRDIEIAN
jgi:hypothetical protein